LEAIARTVRYFTFAKVQVDLITLDLHQTARCSLLLFPVQIFVLRLLGYIKLILRAGFSDQFYSSLISALYTCTRLGIPPVEEGNGKGQDRERLTLESDEDRERRETACLPPYKGSMGVLRQSTPAVTINIGLRHWPDLPFLEDR
jgi:hypothetical protein